MSTATRKTYSIDEILSLFTGESSGLDSSIFGSVYSPEIVRPMNQPYSEPKIDIRFPIKPKTKQPTEKAAQPLSEPNVVIEEDFTPILPPVETPIMEFPSQLPPVESTFVPEVEFAPVILPVDRKIIDFTPQFTPSPVPVQPQPAPETHKTISFAEILEEAEPEQVTFEYHEPEPEPEPPVIPSFTPVPKQPITETPRIEDLIQKQKAERPQPIGPPKFKPTVDWSEIDQKPAVQEDFYDFVAEEEETDDYYPDPEPVFKPVPKPKINFDQFIETVEQSQPKPEKLPKKPKTKPTAVLTLQELQHEVKKPSTWDRVNEPKKPTTFDDLIKAEQPKAPAQQQQQQQMKRKGKKAKAVPLDLYPEPVIETDDSPVNWAPKPKTKDFSSILEKAESHVHGPAKFPKTKGGKKQVLVYDIGEPHYEPPPDIEDDYEPPAPVRQSRGTRFDQLEQEEKSKGPPETQTIQFRQGRVRKGKKEILDLSEPPKKTSQWATPPVGQVKPTVKLNEILAKSEIDQKMMEIQNEDMPNMPSVTPASGSRKKKGKKQVFDINDFNRQSDSKWSGVQSGVQTRSFDQIIDEQEVQFAPQPIGKSKQQQPQPGLSYNKKPQQIQQQEKQMSEFDRLMMEEERRREEAKPISRRNFGGAPTGPSAFDKLMEAEAEKKKIQEPENDPFGDEETVMVQGMARSSPAQQTMGGRRKPQKKQQPDIDENELFWGASPAVNQHQDLDNEFPALGSGSRKRKPAPVRKARNAAVEYLLDALEQEVGQGEVGDEFVETIYRQGKTDLTASIQTVVATRERAIRIVDQYQRKFPRPT